MGVQSKLLHAAWQLPCVQVPAIREKLTTTAFSAEEGALTSWVLAGVSGSRSSRPGSDMVVAMAWIQLFQRAPASQIEPQI